MRKKLLLFDIDGTLITCHGIPKRVFVDVIQKRFPVYTNGHEVAFSGMTDPLIVQEVLKTNDKMVSIDDPLIDSILNEFIIELRKNLNKKSPPSLLPGVQKLLQESQEKPDIFIGLVTGNVMHGAKIKLEAVDIYKHFSVGAFGSDDANRNNLPPLAIQRSKNYFRTDFEKEDIWIIGDSKRDVECAQANNLNILTVETGFVSEQDFKALGVKFIMPAFENTNHFWDYIYS